MSLTVTVNGTPRTLEAGTTVADAVATVAPDARRGGGVAPDAWRGVAVAVNDTVVPRAAWDTTALTADDRIEVLTAVQGG